MITDITRSDIDYGCCRVGKHSVKFIQDPAIQLCIKFAAKILARGRHFGKVLKRKRNRVRRPPLIPQDESPVIIGDFQVWAIP